MGACRVQHLTATCESHETQALCTNVAKNMKEGLESMTGCKVPDEAFLQATIAVSGGGVGLLNPMETNANAHLSSLLKLPETFRSPQLEPAYQSKLKRAAAAVGSRMGKTAEEILETSERLAGQGMSVMQELNRTYNDKKKAHLMTTADPQPPEA